MTVETPPLEQAGALEHSCDRSILIAGICGSLRAGSYTRMALQVALAGAAEIGAQTSLIDLRDFDLPFASGDEGSPLGSGVLRLRKLVREADGIVLGTPEYHGSLSGVLKNALDLMGFDQFEGKMIGLVGVSGGRMGAFEALNALRGVGRALHAWVVPEQASIPEAWRVFGPNGEILDEAHGKRVKEVGRQVARFAHLHKCAEAHDFLKSWEAAPANPGGE